MPFNDMKYNENSDIDHILVEYSWEYVAEVF